MTTQISRVLFLDSVHPVLEEFLTEKSISCEHNYTSTYKELLGEINNFDGLVIRSRFPLDKEFLSKAQHLKFIARSGAGLENIDLEAAKKFEIEVFNSPEGNMDAVGEQAIAMLLMLFNNLLQADAEARQGIWKREENRGIELKGKTLGIIGFGKMGSALAEKLQGFGVTILAHDKYKNNFAPTYVQEVSLQKLQAESDIVSIHLPLSTETVHYLNEEFITKMKKPFYLINTARGKHVSLEALLKGLKNKKVLGACLDVLEIEKKSFENLTELPPVFTELAKRKDVILSPHIAGWTKESYLKLSSFLAEKIEKKFRL
jgi:D-3-phosphoglycerate dehydrogenase